MAKSVSTCFFLFFLYFLCRCSSGTMVGFSYHANGNTTTSSPGRTIAFLKRNKIVASHIRVFVEDQRLLRSLGDTGVSVDLYLNEGHLQISELKSYIMPFLSQVKIKSIVATSGDYTRQHALSMLLTTLKSVNSILSSFTADRGIKVSAAFPLSYLENVSTADRRDLHRICDFIKKVKSCVVIEAEIDGELSIGERYVNAMIESASLAYTLFPCNDVPMMLTFKSPAIPSATEVAAFVGKVSKALENSTNIANSIVGMYAQVSPMEDFAKKEMKRAEEQLFATSRRELLRNDLYEAEDSSPTIFPTTTPTPPISTNIPTPAIVTVPTTNPVTVAPFNPMPSTTPVTVSSTNPVYSPIPEANPTTAPPITVPLVITNPVTTYPPPTGPVPVTTPLVPPATSTNAPGQSWCVAKAGAAAAAVQAGLDYACGKVDCSQLQQGGSCFSPVTLQNHASYAFNSYYQKNPIATSCDFGGVATIVATNPSTGSCSYLSSSTTATPTTAPPITVPLVITNPITTYPPPTGPVPVTTPLAPPATSTNAPGQSWCVAKVGAAAAAVQAGLDYACGKVDCSQLQQGGSCFSPVTLQNHASYAFNSYYQKNPIATSCDFGGVATIVATNPSTGSCSYLSSSTTATPTTAPPITVPLVITNPITTYPPPTGPVPVTTPLAPPATSTNAPGQSWCVAKVGAAAAAVQAGLDYACGKVDCSQLQQGGSCFSPVTLQNHASYAFNSYYQKNPVATSCDFGGVATIVATNPSTGSCSYLSSSTTATPTPAITTPPISTPFAPVVTTPTPTPEPTTPLPASTTPPTPTFTAFPPPEAVSGSGIPPPSVLNSSNPASSGSMPEFGMDIPPGYNSSTSSAASLQPFVSYMFLLTAMVKFCYLNM